MFNLSPTELRILELFGQGMTEHEIATDLGLPAAEYRRIWMSLADKIDWHEAHTYEEMSQALVFERARRATNLAQLNACEARLNALMDLSPSGIVVVDGRTGKILQFNAPAAEMFGYAPEEFRGMEVEQLVPPDRRELHIKQRLGFLTSIRKREIGYHPPIFALKKDGSLLEMDIGLIATTATDDVMVVCRKHEVPAGGSGISVERNADH